MMKKVLLLLSFLAAFFVSNAQFPVTQFLGRDSSLVDSRGGMKARLILYSYTDTASANLERISQYPGAIIYVTSTNSIWLRNADATAWGRVAAGGGGGNGIASLGTSAYGLTIQNDSTYKVDTSKVSTRLWRQKGIDSVQSNVNLKLNITDTANIRARLYAGSNITITGTYPNLTIASTGGGGGGGITTVGTINGISKSTNGAVISGSNIYMQTVDGTYPGLMTSAQKARLDSNSYITIDKRYDSLAWRRNDSTFLVKSLRLQLNGATVTPTVTDSSLSYNIVATAAVNVRRSIEKGTGDSLQLVNDSASFVNANKVYGYSNGVRGWKDVMKMTLTNQVNGDAIIVSGDSLINGRKVDSIYRTAGKDSIIFLISGTRYAIKDSTGGGGGGTPGGSTTQVQYNNAGSFAGSSNMTFDGTQLYLPSSSTQSGLKVGGLEMQHFATNNNWLSDNVYFNAGFKARVTGYTPMIYFNSGAIELQTSTSTSSAGAAAGSTTRLKIIRGGNISIGPGASSITPTAQLHFTNGLTTAGGAPMKIYLTGSGILATPEAGAIEFKVDSAYYTGENGNRYQLTQSIYGSATLDFASTSAQTSTDLTITNVTGAADGDIVCVGMPNASTNANSCFTAWVSAANTVTVRFNNYSSGAIDPASGTFKIRVLK
jgi:hypothetical protein